LDLVELVDSKNELRKLLKKVNNSQTSFSELREIFDGKFRSILEKESGNEELSGLVEELTEAFAKRVGEFRKN